jgi:hypothetical protein
MGVTMPVNRGPTMQEKVAQLRVLVDEVGLVSVADLAQRWDVSHEGARKFMDGPGAPVPVYRIGRMKVWALPEVERYRSTRLLGPRS